jgi:hypothetical protein
MELDVLAVYVSKPSSGCIVTEEAIYSVYETR